jgi:hypothetical protein
LCRARCGRRRGNGSGSASGRARSAWLRQAYSYRRCGQAALAAKAGAPR